MDQFTLTLFLKSRVNFERFVLLTVREPYSQYQGSLSDSLYLYLMMFLCFPDPGFSVTLELRN